MKTNVRLMVLDCFASPYAPTGLRRDKSLAMTRRRQLHAGGAGMTMAGIAIPIPLLS